MNIKEDILPHIKPSSKDENGKYNKKLYNLLKKLSQNEYQNRQFKVFFNPKSWWDGEFITFNKNIHNEIHCFTRQIILSPYGSPDNGYSLMNSLNKGNPEHYSWIMHRTEQFVDITDWFINTYKGMGRCMFDKYHYDFDNKYNERYYIINKNSRKCKWCGEHFHREIHKKVKISKNIIWKST